jgi:dihydroorotate dehydrogenase (fumarate)
MAVDLTTRYLGLTLRNPLVVAPCPLTNEIHTLQQLEEAGAGAVELVSLFEEQIRDELAPVWLSRNSGGPGEAVLGMRGYNGGLESYLRHIELARGAVKIPVIASINAIQRGDWIRAVRLIEMAGADALELNVYFVPTDPAITAAQIEDQYIELISAVRSEVKLPLAVKVSPYFTSLPNLAARIVAAGANGLVLFNRFIQPDINVNTLEASPHLDLSMRSELRLPLRWIAILRGQFDVSLGATTGIHFTEDVIKMLLAGADVTMLASALLRFGPARLAIILEELTNWLDANGFQSVDKVRGMLSQRHVADSTVFERANYTRAITSFAQDTH